VKLVDRYVRGLLGVVNVHGPFDSIVGVSVLGSVDWEEEGIVSGAGVCEVHAVRM
jgi:hypothetical protein